MINRIRNKGLCWHTVCVCTVYIYYVYIDTHTQVYTNEKYVRFIYKIFTLYII